MKIYRFKPKHEKNALFIKVLIVVGVIQVAAMLFLGGMMITQALIPQEAEFEAPPPPQDVKEPEKQREVVLKKSMKRSSSAVRRINVVNPQMTNTPDLTISLPQGLGGDGDGGINISGIDPAALAGTKLDFKLPEFSLFGIKGASDRVVIAFDVSAATMTDDMGGLPAFNVVKDEIKSLVNGLPATVMFNVLAIDNEHHGLVQAFRSSLVPANPTNKAAFESWMAPLNQSYERVGIQDPNYTLRFNPPPYNSEFPYHQDVWQNIWVVNRYKTYQAAMEQGAGVVFFLTSSWRPPKDYWVKLTDTELANYNKRMEKARDDFVKRGGKIVDKEVKNDLYRKARQAGKAWLDAENARRRSKKQPEMVVRDTLGIARNIKDPNAVQADNMKSVDDFRQPIKWKSYTQSSLLAHYEPMFKKLYDERDLPRPTLNMIIMLPKKVTEQGESPTKEHISAASRWAKAHNNGKIRVLRGAKPFDEYQE